MICSIFAPRRLRARAVVLAIAGAACTRHVSAIAPVAAPGPATPRALPAEPEHPIRDAERAEVVDHLIAGLDQHYVWPEKARAIGQALRGRIARGEYAAITTGERLARALTDDLVSITHDKHLEVRYFEAPVPPGQGAESTPPTAMDAEEAAEQRYLNHGVFEARRMKFNIGYLNFGEFGRPGPTAEKLAAAMLLVNDTASLIVDLRECHGGDTDTVTLAESYFVPPNTHLLDLYTRSDNSTERAQAAATLAGPRYAADKAMFVLISEVTASGCEAFAYAMQSHKRATVIGAVSAGAAYFGEPRRLSDHFMAFIPVGRPIDPITHGDWEGVGVTPAVAVPAATALAVAERKSLEAIQPGEPSRRRKDAMQKRIIELSRP